jgi:hypothetical protein
MLNLNNLLIMQNGVRNPKQIQDMIEFVKKGGIWTQDVLHGYAEKNNLRPSPVMEISLFPDNTLMIHDGHHRAIAVNLAGRKFLYDEEYIIRKWSYEEYSEVNFESKWVTPFDPRTHLRAADISYLKNNAMDIYKKSGAELAHQFILENKNKFFIAKNITTIEELSNLYLKDLNNDFKLR